MDNCKVIAISNRKGGVDKTTTTMNLGVGPNKFYGKKVLLLDADPQSSLTIALGTGNPDVPDDTLAAAMSAVIDDRTFNETAGIPITTGKCRMNCFIRQYVGENDLGPPRKYGGLDPMTISCYNIIPAGDHSFGWQITA